MKSFHIFSLSLASTTTTEEGSGDGDDTSFVFGETFLETQKNDFYSHEGFIPLN